ncbi:hypothetical protein CEQ90_06325 [Lewinellaceae bacterium SD302]|nr:hypothetical protein CEQ90_06325 [Lewinellaceae bacterium SD302]
MQNFKAYVFSFLFLAMIALAGTQVHAQVTTTQMSMSQGNHPAMTLELPGADAKMVEKMWVDYTKDEIRKSKTKKDRKSKEYQTLNVEIPGVSKGSAVDMYAKVNERGNGSELMVWIGSNDGWISPDELPGRYVEAEKMLMRFGLEVSRAQIEIMVEAEEDKLEDLEKELEDLRRDKEKFLKNIEKAKQEIADNEAAIETNAQQQKDQEEAIEEQRKTVNQTRKKGDF